jgi:hypothetical protein
VLVWGWQARVRGVLARAQAAHRHVRQHRHRGRAWKRGRVCDPLSVYVYIYVAVVCGGGASSVGGGPLLSPTTTRKVPPTQALHTGQDRAYSGALTRLDVCA